MWSFIIYTVCQTLGYEEQWKMGRECAMHGSEGNVEQIFVCKTRRKESIQKARVNL
jgi:hypothetical protein